MKRALIIVLLSVIITPVGTGGKTKHITILHTNDTHSCIMPLSVHLNDTMQAGRGGYLRRLEVVSREREKDKRLLLFDSGDFSQGSPYYTLFKGEVEIGLMNEMGYDAATIGNHEFDFGLDNMARIFKKAKFPVLCANYDFTGTSCEGIVKPYTIIKRKGVKIGIIGLSPKLEGLVMAKTCQGVKYLDPIPVTKRLVEYLKKKKHCDMVIVISHLGWGPLEGQDQDVISHTNGIDLVLGGHSHSYFKDLKWVNNIDGVPVADDQNGKNAIFIGKIIVRLEK